VCSVGAKKEGAIWHGNKFLYFLNVLVNMFESEFGPGQNSFLCYVVQSSSAFQRHSSSYF
jgi:hypothetical protein